MAETTTNALAAADQKVPFGPQMRTLFNFAPTYRPLNHGSYGTFPKSVFDFKVQRLRDYEARDCIYKRFVYPGLLKESRALVAPLLGAHTDEVVFVPNATSGVNTVLRNIKWEEGDVIIYPQSIYGACLKSIQSVGEVTPVRGVGVEYLYPVEDDEIETLFRERVKEARGQGKNVRMAVFDTIVSIPGVRVPWERMVAVCRELGILSLIDGAHAIGHIDMTHTGTMVQPDFLVSNCHK